MRITINAGTTFLISDTLGNVPDGTELRLYHEDARFLSRYDLTLDGKHPLPLAATPTAPYAAVFYATNPVLRGAPQGTLSLIRRRVLDDALHEDIEMTNFGDTRATCELRLALDADFAHLFEVKRMLAANRPQAWAMATTFPLLVAMTGALPLPDGVPAGRLPRFLPEAIEMLAVDGIWYPEDTPVDSGTQS